MSNSSFEQQLIEATAEDRSTLIASRPAEVGEAEVDAIAERARATSDANPAESLHLAQICLELAAALEQPRARALALRAHAVALRASGEWERSLSVFDAGAAAAQEAGDALLAAQIPIAAVTALAQLSRYQEAFELGHRLIQSMQALGADADVAKVYYNIGNIHFLREAYTSAQESWEKALAYFEANRQERMVAGLKMNIANVLTHLNRLPQALQMYESALDTLQNAGMDFLAAGIEGNIGFHQFMGGRYTEALQSYGRARKRFVELQMPQDVAQCDRETADVYLDLNLAPEAQETFERILPLFREMNMSGEAAKSELGLAMALAAQQRDVESDAALKRAEQEFAKEGNEIGVAKVKLRRAEVERRALGHGSTLDRHAAPVQRIHRTSNEALKLFDKHGVKAGVIQARLQIAEMQVDMGGSPISTLRRLLREAVAGSYIALVWRLEAALARAFKNSGKQRGTLLHYRRAVEAVERMRLLLYGDDFRVSFLQDKMRLYEEFLALLLDRGTPAALREGFQLTERSKSRTLLELLDHTTQNQSHEGGEHRALLNRLEELRSQLNWDYARIQQISGTSERLPAADATLSQSLPGLEREYLHTHRQLQIAGHVLEETPTDATIHVDATVHIKDLQKLLDLDEHLVEFVTVGDEVLAFIVSRENFQSVRCLASKSEVEAHINRLRFQWSKFGPIEHDDRFQSQLTSSTHCVLQTLYELLLEPLEGYLSLQKLTIIPHGLLHAVPFHALYDGNRYALDRWEFAYAPSAAVWQACRLRGETESEQSFVVGVSDEGITCVRDEVAALRKLLPEASLFEDEAATLDCIPNDGQYRYLHFATHAIFRRDNPLFSGLRLSDGWLIAHDLYRRRLECHLATLSACRTGLSSVVPGDELLGLVRGFLCAGARAVMVSLWAAHDAATAQLMQHVYSLLAKGVSRAAALRTAQQSLRARYPHPYYWAAFALVGVR